MHIFHSKRKHRRHGTTTVEAAIVFPLFFVFLYGIVAFGHVQLVNNMMNRACRTGARLGAVEGTTLADVQTHVTEALKTVVSSANVTIAIKDATTFDTGTPDANPDAIKGLPDLVSLANAEPGQLFVVRADVKYEDVSLLPLPASEGSYFPRLGNMSLYAQAFMRHE